MKKDNKVFLLHILECIKLIEKYTKGLSEKNFLSSKEKQDSVLRRLEIIGEAARNLINITSAIAAFIVTLKAMKQIFREDVGGGFIDAAYVKPFQALISLLSRLRDFIVSNFTEPIQEAGQSVDENIVQPISRARAFIQENLVGPIKEFIGLLKILGGFLDQYLIQPLTVFLRRLHAQLQLWNVLA